MSLLPDPDTYEPTQDRDGVYHDWTPTFNGTHNGIKCPCSASIKDQTIFTKSSNWNVHCKTKRHINWLEHLNSNRHNALTEVNALREENRHLKQINVSLSNEKAVLNLQITGLINAIVKLQGLPDPQPEINLLDE